MQKEMFRNKKAQLTIFIILAIIIVVGIGIWFFAVSDTGKSMFGGGFGDDVKNNMETCIQSLGYDSLYFIGMQGGYYKTPEPKESFSYLEIPVYYDKGQAYITEEATIEKQLALAIKENIDICTEEIINKTPNYKIQIGDIKGVTSSFKRDAVKITVNIPITITKGEETQTISQYNSELNFNFDDKYNTMLEAIETQKSRPSDLITIAPGELNVSIEGIQIGNNTFVYTLIFPNDKNNEQEFLYSFVSKISA